MMPNEQGEEFGGKGALPVFKTLMDTLQMVWRRSSVMVPIAIGAGLFKLAFVFISNNLWTGSQETALSEINLPAWVMLITSLLLFAWSLSATTLLVAALERKENLSVIMAMDRGLQYLLPLVLNWVLFLMLSSAVCLPLLIFLPGALVGGLAVPQLGILGWSLIIGTAVIVLFFIIKYGLMGAAIVLGHYGPVAAFKESSRTVSGQFMRFAGLLLLLIVSGSVLSIYLEQIPVVGIFISVILTSFWFTGTVALVYLRSGFQTVDA